MPLFHHIRISAFVVLFCATLLATNGVHAFPGSSDQVVSLPGLDFPINYRHYSGYLSSIKNTSVHYWFFESQSGANNATDPLVVWLNGGPGCSSLFGEMMELGPIQYNADSSTIQPNPNAWNQRVNLLFLESPSGVGFTFRPGQTNYSTDDDETSQLNYQALKAFFVKFPYLTKNDFYLTGESYGGFYIPTLAMRVLDGQFPANFKGVAIGDGLLDWDLSPKDSRNHLGKAYAQLMMRSKQHHQLQVLRDESDYLNRADVKQALHIPTSWTGTWAECNYDVLGQYAERKNHDMHQQVSRIVASGLRSLFYQGEDDPLISWTGNKQFIDQLGLANLTDLVPWYYKGKEAGRTEKYDKQLTFTTFHGAGHMVPEDKPPAAYQMITDFLFNH